MFYCHLFGINIVWNNCSTLLYCSLMLISPPRTVTTLSPTRWAHQSCSSLLTDLSVRKSAAVPTVTSPTTPTRASGFPSGSSAALKWVPTVIFIKFVHHYSKPSFSSATEICRYEVSNRLKSSPSFLVYFRMIKQDWSISKTRTGSQSMTHSSGLSLLRTGLTCTNTFINLRGSCSTELTEMIHWIPPREQPSQVT